MTRWIVVFLSLVFVSGVATAHPEDSSDVREAARISSYINAAMGDLAARTKEFNSQMATINALKPLELTSLDSITVQRNAGLILGFTQFLDRLQAAMDSGSALVEDSLFAIAEASPNPDVHRSLQDFGDSYKLDQKAFLGYVSAMKDVYSDVLTSLLFLDHTKYEMVKGQLQFTSKDDVERYNVIMKKISDETETLKAAAATAKKAEAKANEMIQALNKLHLSSSHK